MPADFEQFIFSLILTMARVTPIVITGMSGIFERLPSTAKFTFVFCLGLLLTNKMYEPRADFEFSVVHLIFNITSELFIGSVFILAYLALNAALQFVGKVLDVQIGFGAATIFDPKTSQTQSLLGSLFAFVAIILIFEFELHLELISVISYSLDVAPVGSAIENFNIHAFSGHLSKQFLMALILILPILITLFLVDILSGAISKTMPQANIYFVALPIKIGVGLFSLAIASPHMISAYNMIFSQMTGFLNALVGL